jgi:hypothetical protein
VIAVPPQYEVTLPEIVILFSQPIRECQLTGPEVLWTGMGRSGSAWSQCPHSARPLTADDSSASTPPAVTPQAWSEWSSAYAGVGG